MLGSDAKALASAASPASQPCGKPGNATRIPALSPGHDGGVLLYGYSRGLYLLHQFVRACEAQVDVMAVTGLNRPDLRIIADFLERHLVALSDLFVQMPRLCRAAGLVQCAHVAMDGTRVKANASRRKGDEPKADGQDGADFDADPTTSTHDSGRLPVLGCPIQSVLPVGRTYTTLDTQISDLRPFTAASGTLTVAARAIDIGALKAVTEAQLTDADDQACATATIICLIIERSADGPLEKPNRTWDVSDGSRSPDTSVPPSTRRPDHA